MTVLLEIKDHVGVITLDSARTRNALDLHIAEEFLAFCGEISRSSVINAVVIRGENQTFCSGADRDLLSEAKRRPADADNRDALAAIYACFSAVASLPVPTIAAVKGAAVGAGLNLALACDVRIMATDARILSGFLRIGLHPGGGHFTMLERLVGPQAAVAMTLLGEELTGQRLVDVGLAWEILDAALVDDRALELAGRMADHRLTRDAMATFRAQSASRQLPLATAIRAEQAAQFDSLARGGGQ